MELDEVLGPDWRRHGWKIAILAGFLVIAPQCRQAHRQPASIVDVADPATESQLTAGFYGLESHHYRWTARKFVVALAPPGGGGQDADLQLEMFIPEGQIEKLGAMTLSAGIDGYAFAPETYSKGGTYTYSRMVPASALNSNIVPVLFTFDKAMSPAAADGRELAAVVTKIGLHSK